MSSRVFAGDEVTAELRHVTRDGRTRWIELRTCAERDGAGRVVQLCGAGLDITERRELTDRLRRQEDECGPPTAARTSSSPRSPTSCATRSRRSAPPSTSST